MQSLALEPVRVALAYRLGEFTLFQYELEGLADRRHFTECEPAAAPPIVPQDLDGAGFFFLPCYPVAVPPPVLMRRDGWLFYTPYSFRNYIVDLRKFKTFEEYMGKFSGKSRATLRRKVKRFAETSGGQLRWRVMRTPDEMDEFLRLALPLSERTYQQRLLGAGLPKSTDFARKLRDSAASDQVLGYLLFGDFGPVAYVLCFCRNGIASYDFVGFDPAAKSLSPGTVLQYLILEAMFIERKVAIFDFTEGEGDQKAFFATDWRLCAKTYILPSTLSNRLAVGAHRRLNQIGGSAGRALERWNLKSGLKTLIRRLG